MSTSGPPDRGPGAAPPAEPEDDFDYDWEWTDEERAAAAERERAALSAYTENYNAAVDWLMRQGWPERDAELFVQSWEGRARGRGLTRGMPRYWSALREAAPSRAERLAAASEEPPREPARFRWRIGHRLRVTSSGKTGLVMRIHGLSAAPTALLVQFDDGTSGHVAPDDAVNIPSEPRGRPHRGPRVPRL